LLIKIDFQSEIPIYQQLKNEIVKGIANNNLATGESLPSVRQLASDLGVNLHTINKAYNQLKVEGYVQVDRRKGATISPIPESKDETQEQIIKTDFELLISSAICKGFTKDEIEKLVINIYQDIKKGDKYE